MSRVLLTIICLLCLHTAAEACTAAVISAAASADGRPLLWKQRDTEIMENSIRYFEGEKHAFAGIVSADSTADTRVWIGTNEVGFAIMNTATYNIDQELLQGPEYAGSGEFMKLALGRCASVAEFEALLDETAGARGTRSNFGVIDAVGGAAWFETGSFTYVKYDVNDPVAAPNGYLIRTNYSHSGNDDAGFGFIRFETAAEHVFGEFAVGDGIAADFLLQNTVRSLRHSLLGTDLLRGDYPRDSHVRTMVPSSDYLARYYTVSAMVIQGVKGDEDPRLTTMWTVLGLPLVTPVFPVWVDRGLDLPEFIELPEDRTDRTRLNALTTVLRDRVYPLRRGSGANYLDLAVLLNEEGDGLLQQVLALDESTCVDTSTLLANMREKGFNSGKIRKHQRTLEERCRTYFATNSH
ncbi:MAG: hypothetical protein GY835_15795 [bacterium]|nr:hypothetical protein [bacterium]